MILPVWHGLVLALFHLLIPCEMQESTQDQTNLELFVQTLNCHWAVMIAKLLIPSKRGNLYLGPGLGLSLLISALYKKSDGGNRWHLWVLGLHWGLTVSWERVFELLVVTVLGGRSGVEEVKY